MGRKAQTLKDINSRSKNGAGRKVGRPAKKTEDKADAAEMRKAQTNRLPIDANRLLHHINTIKGYNQKIDNLSGSRRQAFAAMKADRIDPQVVRDLIKLEKGDPLEFREYLEQMGVGLKATGQMFQLNVFDTAFGDPVAQATAEGRDDASNGRTVNNRYAEGTPESEAYLIAYHKVQSGNVPGAQLLTEEQREDAVAEA